MSSCQEGYGKSENMRTGSARGEVVSDYWFAGRFPVGHPRKAMAPVRQEVWLVVAAFGVALVAGAVAGAMPGLSGAPVSGVVVFAGIGLLAGALIIVIANRKGDHARMVAGTSTVAGGFADLN